MKNYPKLESIVKPIIKNLGFIYSGISYNKQKKNISVFISKKTDKITDEDCEKVHYNLTYVLNVENYILLKKYNFEVSSKNINSLILPYDLKKFIKKTLKIVLTCSVNQKFIIYGQLILASNKKQKIYLQNKKKIILLHFYQIDKIQMI